MARGNLALKLVDSTQPGAQPQADFEWFWQEYPRKKSKGDAFKAWQQTASIRPPIEEIIGAIERNFQNGTWKESEKDYIPYPATWLRAWGWADEE